MTINPLASEGQKDRAAYDAAAAQADAVGRATAKNTPTGSPRDLAAVHEGLCPMPEYAARTADGSTTMPPKPWQPGDPIPARQMPAPNSDSTQDTRP